jgi:hypothetical protein
MGILSENRFYSFDHPTFVFCAKLEAWPADIRDRLVFTILPIQYPSDQEEKKWRQLFKPCASQRLFIPVSFTSIMFAGKI